MDHLNAQRGLVNLFTSDSYQLLCLLDELQTDTLDGKRVRESQEEIAELFHVSKGKLNPLMQSVQVAAVMLLPLVWGVDGIWISVAVAELAAAALGYLFILLRGSLLQSMGRLMILVLSVLILTAVTNRRERLQP